MDPAHQRALDTLDRSALSHIFSNAPGRVQHPVVQCLQIKSITGQPGAPDRYRVVLSDGTNYVQAMLATTVNELIESGQLQRGSFARLKAYQANAVKGKKILIITDLEAVHELGVLEKVGSPSMCDIKEEGDSKVGTISSNGFYGNNAQGQQQQQQQQQQSRAIPSHSKGPGPSSSEKANIYPIEALSPYSHKWTIKARCTHKGDIKTWHNRNGEGKLFSANFLDESGEIRATGFNDQCDLLYDMINEGNVYYISSPCRVQIAKKQFSNLPNDYELTFEKDTVVEKAEAQDDVPQVRYNFTTIADLQTVEKDTTIDIVAVLKDVGETSQITSKTTNKPYDKRELTLVDSTGYSVRLTVWGKLAGSFDVPPESVVAFKGVKVSDFGGRSLSLLSSGSMTANPDMDEAHKLKGWYDAQGSTQDFATHQGVQGAVGSSGNNRDPFMTVALVKDKNLGMSDQPDFFALKGTVQYIKQDNFCYPACRSEGCNKKVIEMDPGQWRCEKCDKTHEKPEYRYIMSVNVMDHTGQLWLSCFDEVGRMIMGKSADELMELKEVDDKKVSEIFSDANCTTWNWKCKARMDTFQEQQRVRYQVSSASPLNFQTEAAKLEELIKQYNLD